MAREIIANILQYRFFSETDGDIGFETLNK